MLIVWFLALLAGFLCLWKGSDWLIDSASHLARTWGVSDAIVGFSILALGTSLPELIVSLFASLSYESDIVLGNVIGSNISNTLLILGLSCVITGIKLPLTSLRNNVYISSFAHLLFLFLLAFFYYKSGIFVLNQASGLVLIIAFIIFLIWQFKTDLNPSSQVPDNNLKNYLFFLLGCSLLFLGGKLVVESATNLALGIGLSKAFIALFLVALGTSLPELATTIMAIKKNKTQLALGNIFGSNVFNICLVLATSMSIHPIIIETAFLTDIVLMCFAPFAVLIIARLQNKLPIKLVWGLSLLAYISYVIFITIRA